MQNNELVPIKNSNFNILEICKYKIDFQIVQELNMAWVFCLQIYPEDLENGFIKEDEAFSLQQTTKIKDVNTVILHSQGNYSFWEYAAESAVDVIELLGFSIDNIKHNFKIAFWDEHNEVYVQKDGIYQNCEFRLANSF